MGNNLKFFYRVDNQGNPVPGTLQRFNQKPDNGRWHQLAHNNVCCGDGCCPDQPVRFDCIDNSDYIEFYDNDNVYLGLYVTGGLGTYNVLIPRGTMHLLVVNTSDDGKTFYINGKPVGEMAGGGDLVIEDLNTCDITQMGFSDGTETAYTVTSNEVFEGGGLPMEVIFGTMSTILDGGTNITAVEVHAWLVENNTYNGAFTLNSSDNTITFNGMVSTCGEPPVFTIQPIGE